MGILNSKKLKELQAENEELKSFIQTQTEKELQFKQLDDLIKKTRVEIANTILKKDQTTLTLDRLDKEKVELNSQVQKLSSEIKLLREMKLYEEKQIFILNGKTAEELKSSGNIYIKSESNNSSPIYKEIEQAEKKKNEIQRETIEMENRFREIYQKVLEAGKIERTLDAAIKKKKEEFKNIDASNKKFSQEQMQNFYSRISALKDEEKKNLLDIKLRIKHLSDREIELNDRLKKREEELLEIEDKIKMKDLNISKEAEEKLVSLVVEEQKLNDSIKLKKQTIYELELTEASLKEEKNKINNEIANAAAKLNLEMSRLKEQDDRESKAEDITNLELEATTIQGIIKALKEEEKRIRESIEQLVETESLKKKLFNELTDNISAKEMQYTALTQDFDTKSRRLNEISVKNKLLMEELAAKTNEMSSIESTLKTKTSRLNDLTVELNNLEIKITALNNDVAEKDILKNHIENKINSERENWHQLEEYYRQLKETLPLLEKRKSEMGLSNELFEKRFADMFKHYSSQMGEMYKKKKLLEQMLIKKEMDVNEKDEILLDKLAGIDEAEKVLIIRKTEAESIDDVLKTINEQKEMIAYDITKMEEKNIEKRIQNKELHIENDLFQKKLIEFESGLKELFRRSEERFNTNSEKRSHLETELREYESRLNEINKSIRDSMNELVDLRTSISRIKVEHEEHRLGINKLVAVKKKLEEEIIKHQVVIDKYTRIKERIRQDQEIIKRKREILASRDINNANENEKSFEPRHLNWIKL